MTNIKNQMNVIVLQHFNEVSQTKGSLTLLANSLEHCTVIIGENFSDNKELNQLLIRYKNNAYLLYPHQHSQTLNDDKNNVIDFKNSCLIILDGTWRKAYRMFMLSKNLHPLQKVELPNGYKSFYDVRKTTVTNGLSTLEACCYALEIIERDNKKYQKLITNFKLFNDFLLSYTLKDKIS